MTEDGRRTTDEGRKTREKGKSEILNSKSETNPNDPSLNALNSRTGENKWFQGFYLLDFGATEHPEVTEKINHELTRMGTNFLDRITGLSC
jgi:hypothetical protein